MLFLPGEASKAGSQISPLLIGSFVGVRNDARLRGFSYMVVLVPNKSTVYGDLLLTESPYVKTDTLANQAEVLLRQNGVAVLNLTDPMKCAARKMLPQKRYLWWRDDTHWNRYGVQVAAQETWKLWQQMMQKPACPAHHSRPFSS